MLPFQLELMYSKYTRMMIKKDQILKEKCFYPADINNFLLIFQPNKEFVHVSLYTSIM